MPPGHSAASRSTIQPTGRASSSAGPKFQPRPNAGRPPAGARPAEVAGERLEHVLPGADRGRVADRAPARRPARRARRRGRAGPGAQSPPPMTLPARAEASRGAVGAGEERAPVRRGDQLGARLAAAVGVVAAHRLVLAVAPVPARGSRSTCRVVTIDHGAHAVGGAHGLEHVARCPSRWSRRSRAGRVATRRTSGCAARWKTTSGRALAHHAAHARRRRARRRTSWHDRRRRAPARTATARSEREREAGHLGAQSRPATAPASRP